MVASNAGNVATAWAQENDGVTASESSPLATKEQMVRDRYRRFEDRVFRLREQLSEVEPQNARRLERVLERAGGLELADRLEKIMHLLDRATPQADMLDEQNRWLNDAERVLAILLERDSDNDRRKSDIERLQAYQESLEEILEQQQGLRDESARGTLAQRMARQLEQAIGRVDDLLKAQSELADEGGRDQADAQRQRDLARDTTDLAEDLKHLADSQPEGSSDSPALEASRASTAKASDATRSGANAMSQASDAMKQGESGATAQQQRAIEALERAKKNLEQARRELEGQLEFEEMADEQENVAEQTKGLSDEMRQDETSARGGGQPGGPNSQPPGAKALDEAGEQMDRAGKALESGEPQRATSGQDQAIDRLEQAKRELQRALNQLRKEEQEETLRDLEVRLREMLFKQRPINQATLALDEIGNDRFTRVEELQLADLSTKERALGEDASTCLHILDEDGTTVVFPRVVGQLSDDMTTVADRLVELQVGAFTQQIEAEIVDTLEQLLAAVQQMQRENEQKAGDMAMGGDENTQLLPTSAELKLLRSSQLRVNTRTVAIESEQVTDSPQAEPSEAWQQAAAKIARRQKELSTIASEMRERQNRP
ncbi:MAG: hypothetical protein IIB60_01725 [Planctomycetes bacterium]|nr:hypothetical protein [Planctomycetota bacterium]